MFKQFNLNLMADKNETSPSPTGLNQKPGPEAPADAPIDTSLLDQALIEADPNFVRSLTDIGPDIRASDVINDETLNPDGSYLDESGEAQYAHLSFRDRFKRRFKIFKITFVQRLRVLKIRAILFFKETLPELGLQSLEVLKSFLKKTQELLARFAKLKTKQKMSLFAMVGLASLASVVIYKSLHLGILPTKDQILLQQLEDVSQRVIFVEGADGFDYFYDSPRASQNLVSLKRMVFNIRASSLSSSQPMAAVELFLEGYAPEVVVEIKDREAEVLDLFQREGEQMSYDLLSTTEGKRIFAEKLQNAINLILTEGKVKKIFLKNFILKP